MALVRRFYYKLKSSLLFDILRNNYFILVALIILLFLIVLECFITGQRAPTLSGKLFCFGFGVLVGVQSFVNVAVATMLLPNTGVTLPFVSYGLTSLIMMYCGVGIVLNIGLQRNKAMI